MSFLFTHVEYCDMHYVYGYCDSNASAALNEYRRRYPERRIPSKRVFTRVEQSLRDNGCLPSFALHSEREIVRTINARENILDMVQRSPRLSTRRMASRVGLLINNLIWENDYSQVIEGPTRGEALLDVFLVRPGSSVTYSGIVQGVSDHQAVILEVKGKDMCSKTQVERLVPV